MHKKTRDRNMRIETMREYWDGLAKSYTVPPEASLAGRISASYDKLERRLIIDFSLSYLLPASNSILGHIYDLLGEWARTVEIVGIDVSPAICNSAKKKMSNEELMVACADVRKLSFKDETFNIILDLSTLDHIYPAHITSVIREYERAIKEDGIIILVFDWPTFWPYLVKIFNKIRFKENNTFKLLWRLYPVWIEGKLSESGFTILNEFPLGIFSLSLFFLKTSQSNLVGRVVRPLLYGLIRNAKRTKALRHLFPFSRQYLFIARKQRTYEESPKANI